MSTTLKPPVPPPLHRIPQWWQEFKAQRARSKLPPFSTKACTNFQKGEAATSNLTVKVNKPRSPLQKKADQQRMRRIRYAEQQERLTIERTRERNIGNPHSSHHSSPAEFALTSCSQCKVMIIKRNIETHNKVCKGQSTDFAKDTIEDMLAWEIDWAQYE